MICFLIFLFVPSLRPNAQEKSAAFELVNSIWHFVCTTTVKTSNDFYLFYLSSNVIQCLFYNVKVYFKFKWLQRDSNPHALSQTDRMTEHCCEYLSVRCIWLYVFIISRTRFSVNPHSIVAWISRNSLLKTGAKSEV